jgi:hypothetical protein
MKFATLAMVIASASAGAPAEKQCHATTTLTVDETCLCDKAKALSTCLTTD